MYIQAVEIGSEMPLPAGAWTGGFSAAAGSATASRIPRDIRSRCWVFTTGLLLGCGTAPSTITPPRTLVAGGARFVGSPGKCWNLARYLRLFCPGLSVDQLLGGRPEVGLPLPGERAGEGEIGSIGRWRPSPAWGECVWERAPGRPWRRQPSPRTVSARR